MVSLIVSINPNCRCNISFEMSSFANLLDENKTFETTRSEWKNRSHLTTNHHDSFECTGAHGRMESWLRKRCSLISFRRTFGKKHIFCCSCTFKSRRTFISLSQDVTRPMWYYNPCDKYVLLRWRLWPRKLHKRRINRRADPSFPSAQCCSYGTAPDPDRYHCVRNARDVPPTSLLAWVASVFS